MQEIAAKHVIYKPGAKYQNNQLKKKKKKVNVVASGKEEIGSDAKVAIFEANTVELFNSLN